MRDDHLPSLLFDTVGSQRGPTEVVYTLVEGERLLSTSAPSPMGSRGALYGAVATEHTRMDVVM
jgi:hypothetical protein